MPQPHAIQRVVFPADGRPASLYFHAEAADGGDRSLAVSERPSWQRRSLLIPAGVSVSLGSLFNHLPEAHWRDNTAATGFQFTAVVAGAGELRLCRLLVSGEEEVLATQAFDASAHGAEAAQMDLMAEARGEAGVLFVRLIANAGQPLVLGEAQWSALGVTPRPVRLAAGYCTFNREVQLQDNLRAILGDDGLDEHLESLIVVDQGQSEYLATALDCLRQSPRGERIVLRQQGNFGGSGGFARVMAEALELKNATHVLLMDDDAVIETESVFRAARFLSLTENTAVGGQMMDLCLPTILLETGARIQPETLALELLDIFTPAADPRSLRHFARPNPIDYNAWWFFAVPLDLVRRVGLPMPMFIRGDDIEYGLRLKAAGFRTVAVPGIALWHEPFYLKRGWQPYYDMRNTLVLASQWLGLTGWRAARILLSRVLSMLLRYDYGTTALHLQGVEDWLKGPRILAEDPRPRHAAVRALLASHTLPPVSPTRTRQAPDMVITGRPTGFARLWRGLALLARNLFGRECPASPDPLPWIPGEMEGWWLLGDHLDVALRPISLALAAGRKDDWRHIRRSPAACRPLFLKGLVLALRLALFGTRMAARWRDEAPGLRDEASWRRLWRGADVIPAQARLAPPPIPLPKPEPVTP